MKKNWGKVFIKVLGKINIDENKLLKQAKELDNEIIYLNNLKISLANHQKDLDLLEQNIQKIMHKYKLIKIN
ncbi:MAG: hypothetical protein ACLRQF_12760 [Thomasclavelia ramosa]